ncbi:hypothetical protein F0562_001182 [Nyssa sinensis]|uniref:Uncharacterized protein n=1 Tax=Nyssa sinensis TaxID=561372 RepID=A0A5J5C2G5_9ASTE|nr:hypothetical protein F0562_001182 [Nyssa sinensis]
MQTPKARNNSLEVPQKISPRAVRQLKTTTLESVSASSSNQASRTAKDRSPKVNERKSPRSPLPELQKKRPSRISELESQISQLQEDLKKVKDQLISSESWKRQAQQDAEESKKELSAMSLKLEESQKQLLELSASEEARVIELQKISQERDRAWQCEIEAIQKQHSVNPAALSSSMSEIQRLKVQLEMVAESESAQAKHAESAHTELQSLKENLAESLSLVEDMKNQLRNSKASEAQAQELIGGTLLQLETAKNTVETLRLDGVKAMEAYNAIASELEQSRARVNLLEGLVNKLKVDVITDAGSNSSQNSEIDHNLELEIRENEKIGKSMDLNAERTSVKAEVVQLRAALENAEIKYQDERIQSTLQIRSAYELVDRIKSASSLREAELEAELNKTKADIEELKANLMDKETELQCILEENEGLNTKLEKSLSCQREFELENELKKSKEDVEELKANLMDKETELQNISEENEMLKLEIKREINGGTVNDEVAAEVEAARAAEREALMKLEHVTEEANNSNRKAARVAEQLEAAQAANSEIEAELRRLKVQSDQWRKAAEAAAAMLSTGNNGKRLGFCGRNHKSKNTMTQTLQCMAKGETFFLFFNWEEDIGVPGGTSGLLSVVMLYVTSTKISCFYLSM